MTNRLKRCDWHEENGDDDSQEDDNDIHDDDEEEEDGGVLRESGVREVRSLLYCVCCLAPVSPRVLSDQITPNVIPCMRDTATSHNLRNSKFYDQLQIT